MIIDKKIINNKTKIEFTIDNAVHEVGYIYLDTYDNRDNYLSEIESKHSFKFLYDDLNPQVNPSTTIYEISADMLGSDRITGLYILTLIYDDETFEHTIIYDTNELYCIRVKYIDKACKTCTDIANNKLLINLMFKETLFNNAISLNLIDDALKYFTDIFRPFCKNGVVTRNCSNGLCTI